MYFKFRTVCILPLFILLSLFAATCTRKSAVPIYKIDSNINNSELVINSWQIVGAFPYTTEGKTSNRSPSLTEDFLNTLGYDEEKIDANLFFNIGKTDSPNGKSLPNKFTNITYSSKYPYVDFSTLFNNKDGLVVYAGCELESYEDVNIVFDGTADDRLQLWLNNELTVEQADRSELKKLNNLTVAHLKKGRNFLLAKVPNMGGPWALSISLMSINYAKQVAKGRFSNNILQQSIIKDGDLLNVNLELYRGEMADFQIFNTSYKQIYSARALPEKWSKRADDLKPGIYYLKVRFSTDVFEQMFYVGDVESNLSYYKQRLKSYKNIDKRVNINTDVIIARYEHLLENRIYKSSIKGDSWNKRVLFLISALESISKKLERGEDAFKLQPGSHLRGFKSKIDDQVQSYLVHVPKRIDSTPLPVVIIINPLTEILRPFFKSVFLADIDELEKRERLSDQYGFIILMPGGRGKSMGKPTGNTDVFETLDEIKKDYNVDEDRVYLVGHSTGGTGALLLATRFPSIFAALGLVAPFPDTSTLKGFTTKDKLWDKINNPTGFLGNLKNIPMYILAGDADTKSPIENQREFVDKCKASDINISLDVIQGGDHALFPLYSPMQKVFEFFKDKVRVNKPKDITFSTAQLKYDEAYWIKIKSLESFNNIGTVRASSNADGIINIQTKNVAEYEIRLKELDYSSQQILTVTTNGIESFKGIPSGESISINVKDTVALSDKTLVKNNIIEGPLSHAFSEPFILIEGSQGSDSYKKEESCNINLFQDTWKTNSFGNCIVKKDSEVTVDDINGKNLILLGNAETNLIIKQIIADLPLKLSSDHIIIGSNKYSGSCLGFEMIYPNPQNHNKYIVIIGSNNSQCSYWRDNNISQEGYYDFAIWDSSTVKKQIIHRGYFNLFWH
jgi:hypothetical protein